MINVQFLLHCQKCGKEVKNFNPNFDSYSLAISIRDSSCFHKWDSKLEFDLQ